MHSLTLEDVRGDVRCRRVEQDVGGYPAELCEGVGVIQKVRCLRMPAVQSTPRQPIFNVMYKRRPASLWNVGRSGNWPWNVPMCLMLLGCQTRGKLHNPHMTT